MEASHDGGAIHPALRPSDRAGDRQQQPSSRQQQQQQHDELHLSHLPFDPDPHHHHSLGGSAIAGTGNGGGAGVDDVDLPYPHPSTDYQPFSHDDASTLLDAGHHHHGHFQSIEQQHAAEFAELLGQHDHGAPSSFELGGPASSGPGGVGGEGVGSGGGHALTSSGRAVGIDPSTGAYVDDGQGGLGLPFGDDDQDHDQVVNGLIGLAHGHGQSLSIPSPATPPPPSSRKRKKAPAPPKVDAVGSGHSGGEGSQNGQKRIREQVRNACTNCQKTRKKCSGDRPCAACLRHPTANPCVDSSRKKRPVGIKRGKYKTKNRKPEDESAESQGMDRNAVAGPSHLGMHGNPSDNLHQGHSDQQQHLDHQQHEDAYTLYTHSTIDPSLDDQAASSDHHHHHTGPGGNAGPGNPDDEYMIDESTLHAVVEQAQAEARAQHSRAAHGPDAYIGGGGGSRQAGNQIGPEQDVDPHLMSLRLPSDHLPDPQASPSVAHVSPLPPSSNHARHGDRGPIDRPTSDEHDVSLAFLQQLGAASHTESAQSEDIYEPIPSDEQPRMDHGSGDADEYEVIPDHDDPDVSGDADADRADEQVVHRSLQRQHDP